MRRGEWALAALLAIGVALWLVPAGPRCAARPGAPGTGGTRADIAAAGAPAAPPRPTADSTLSRREITIDSYDFDRERATQRSLPAPLREVSGLTSTADGRTLAHNDEKGIVFEIDRSTGGITKRFSIGDARGVVSADFEGIAAAAGRIYLVTSDGVIYEFGEGGDGEQVPFAEYRTGVGRDYEVEGLAYEPRTRELLLASKSPRRKASEGRLPIHRWSIDTRRLVEGGPIAIPVEDIRDRLGSKGFHPSDLARHPSSGNYYLVAALQFAVAEITPGGRLVAVRRLPKKWHLQAEGISFAPDLSLLIADEGGERDGRLTTYPLRPGGSRARTASSAVVTGD
jgi:uncharacterized protein YjiK